MVAKPNRLAGVSSPDVMGLDCVTKCMYRKGELFKAFVRDSTNVECNSLIGCMCGKDRRH